MIEIIDRKAAAARVFTIFADLYKPPSLEIWRELEQKDFLKNLESLVTDLYSVEFSLEGILPDDFGQFCRIHTKAIGSAEENAVFPIESLYKPWTQDETCTLPFACEKGYLLGDPAMHINFILNELQIEIPNEYRGIPDHLSILLELAAYFIENAPEKFSKGFIRDHLDWLTEFERQLNVQSIHPFYERITEMLIKVIEAEHKFHK
ncbi:TorD/DmsD family molecular chaperone [Mesobacillus jeotgali]|uniref:TorD/DmsD family molecular chaperone n=1 Tax=Mesobacillus jeotgali TaxID=129985 RepID=UPI0009A7C4AA|nr:molecular chaperone TorD family protein [Mesobacillus jeotgali]